MSVSYRLLCEGLPTYGESDQGQFHADPRKVKEWIEDLPRANAVAAQRQLRQALESLAGQALVGGQRLAVLEMVRPAVLEQCSLLERSFSASAMPLSADMLRAAEAAEHFQLLLAQGYRRAVVELCAPSGSVPFLKGGSVTQALARSAVHFSRALVLAWRSYRPVQANAWQGLHRIHRFSVELKLDTKAVDDSTADITARTVRDAYLQTVLAAITNPYARSVAAQDAMWAFLVAYLDSCGLCNQSPHENAPFLEEDADQGPCNAGSEGKSGLLWVDLRPLIRDVEQALARLHDGFSELVPERGQGMRLSEDELRQLRHALELVAARRHVRLPGGHIVDTVLGLSAVHFHLAGQGDFSSFLRRAGYTDTAAADKAAWIVSASESQRQKRFPARVVDQSLGGYRLVWSSLDAVKVRVGELAGITFSEPDEASSEWMIVVVRWLRYEPDGCLGAGVELLSRHSIAAALRIPPEGRPMRALELSADEGARRFLVSEAWDEPRDLIEAMRDVEPSMSGGPVSVGQVENSACVMRVGEYAMVQGVMASSGDKA